MAVVVTVAKGYDLGYIWENQAQTSSGRTTGGYYINAARAGEPPGRWWGPGAQALGFTSGQVVERRPYDAVYQQRDPLTGDKLGRPRGRYATFADHLAQLKAAEPYATAERVIELEREAAQATRQPAALHRRDRLVLQVDLGAARLDPGKRAPGAAGWRRAGAGLLVRPGGEVPGDLAPGQPGRAGVPAGLGRGHPDRVSRCPGGRAGAGPVRGGGPGRDVVAAGHQPGRRPAGSHSQSDSADHPDRSGWEVAGAGYREPARGPGRAAGCRRDGGGV